MTGTLSALGDAVAGVLTFCTDEVVLALAGPVVETNSLVRATTRETVASSWALDFARVANVAINTPTSTFGDAKSLPTGCVPGADIAAGTAEFTRKSTKTRCAVAFAVRAATPLTGAA